MLDRSALEKYAELEAAAEVKRRAKMRRQPLYLIAIVNVLVFAVGVTASVDIRRLHTPGGVSLRWTQAALFGACDDYLHFSVPATHDLRAKNDVCRALRTATESNRTNNAQIGLRLRSTDVHGSAAVVDLQVTRDKKDAQVTLHLVKLHGSWKVVRDAVVCSEVGCA